MGFANGAIMHEHNMKAKKAPEGSLICENSGPEPKILR